MCSMIAVLLLATAAVAQPEPLLGGLTANLLGGQGGLIGGLLGGSGGKGLLEGLLGGDGLVGGLVSGLLGPLLGGGGGGLLGGLVGGVGGLLGGGVVGQVGDLVTCVLSQLLGQVGGLLDRILGPVLGALGLQGGTAGNRITNRCLKKLIDDIRGGRGDVNDVIEAFNDGNIGLDDIESLIVMDVLFDPSDFQALLDAGVIDMSIFLNFVGSGVIDIENHVNFLINDFVNEKIILGYVTDGLMTSEVAKLILALAKMLTGGRR